MSVWGKILGGAAGFAIGGPIGAILGGVAGHAVDKMRESAREAPDEDSTRRVAFTIGMLGIYRLGIFIPAPGIDRIVLGEWFAPICPLLPSSLRAGPLFYPAERVDPLSRPRKPRPHPLTDRQLSKKLWLSWSLLTLSGFQPRLRPGSVICLRGTPLR